MHMCINDCIYCNKGSKKLTVKTAATKRYRYCFSPF